MKSRIQVLEAIGKKTTQAGQSIYIDSPANWQVFWQRANNDNLVAKVEAGGVVEKKDTRASQLHALIWRVRQHIYSTGNGSAQKVWNEIQHRHEQHDTDEIIQQVTATEILWRSAYGNEPKFQRTSLDALLTRLKKSPPI